MAAECEIEGDGTLEKAREYVSLVRARAAKAGTEVPGATATYRKGIYTTVWTDSAVARTAVRFERKLELVLEGHHFFDLVCWGIADVALTALICILPAVCQHLRKIPLLNHLY